MYTTISYVAQAYFHQDFDVEADTPLGVVAVFRDSEPAGTVEALHAEIVALLATDSAEKDLARVWLEDAGAYYDPRIDGTTVRDWLREMTEVLAAK
ncbi:hypothetical protein E3E14_30270 [Streptomyces sp. ICN441]|uniref:contact-dependent growth inhibition system immunity protein n=1 Tax=Streptomyces sp. ICN441 TaxID=2558286 RepID=UPI001069C714|nr:contact-dependent growth inhibition system immunity protein [Streptomyces sp. ICN441]TFE37102.1 hypothetical protein E3E14_30270 [Streptomyces sp. ICN441]